MKRHERRAALIRGRSLANTGPHGDEEEKRRQRHPTSAGLIRYFDEEWKNRGKSRRPKSTWPASCLVASFTWSTRAWFGDHEPVLNSQRLNQYDPLVALRHATRHFKRRGEVLGNTQHFSLVGLKHQTVVSW